jgi:hypothetical protein
MRFTCRVPVWLSVLTARANFPILFLCESLRKSFGLLHVAQGCARERVFEQLPTVSSALFPWG